jgi:hypothetical protein
LGNIDIQPMAMADAEATEALGNHKYHGSWYLVCIKHTQHFVTGIHGFIVATQAFRLRRLACMNTSLHVFNTLGLAVYISLDKSCSRSYKSR